MKVRKDDTCNVITYGNTAVEWFAKDVEVIYWPYINKMVNINAKEEDPNADPNDWADFDSWRLLQQRGDTMQNSDDSEDMPKENW